VTVHLDAIPVDEVDDAVAESKPQFDRRDTARKRPPIADNAAIERVVQRVGPISELSAAQVRAGAAIALVAMSVDACDRPRRDHAARENRRRLHRLGRD
jgi:hypothetical protein